MFPKLEFRLFFFFPNIYYFYLFGCTGIVGMWDLVLQPRIDPGPPALGVQSLSHWTNRQVPPSLLLNEEGIKS